MSKESSRKSFRRTSAPRAGGGSRGSSTTSNVPDDTLSEPAQCIPQASAIQSSVTPSQLSGFEVGYSLFEGNNEGNWDHDPRQDKSAATGVPASTNNEVPYGGGFNSTVGYGSQVPSMQNDYMTGYGFSNQQASTPSSYVPSNGFAGAQSYPITGPEQGSGSGYLTSSWSRQPLLNPTPIQSSAFETHDTSLGSRPTPMSQNTVSSFLDSANFGVAPSTRNQAPLSSARYQPRTESQRLCLV